MPSRKDSMVDLPANYTKVPVPTAQQMAQQQPATPQRITRSRTMLASLPGIGSGPDAVLRQFGGRNSPTNRLLVP